ncbi:hypothetical protein [Mahella australiensis]|uniref:Uncharacterized protein n=1 Tax=Mahella australiensis (strain DSM 15567 / CIP 107919 / 50-1 BON) TaxID=697281 RepID=F3ZWX5_MAHA5|nr:hypothetical protein [Mahella australiensis]AEE97597.1 hypothetical protein Mahau_2435 [Mahella australiensis 50-1 BON]
MELLFLMLLAHILGDHPVYILYYVLGIVGLGLMMGFAPRLFKSLLINLPVSYVVGIAIDTIYHTDITLHFNSWLWLYIAMTVFLWLLMILLDLKEIKADIAYSRELKRLRKMEAHPPAVGFVAGKESKPQKKQPRQLPVGFAPPGKGEGYSATLSENAGKHKRNDINCNTRKY